MRDLVIVEWCDVCAADGPRQAGRTWAVEVAGKPRREIELCERHEEQPISMIAGWLDLYGRTVKADLYKRTVKPGEVRPPAAAGSPTRPDGLTPTCLICEATSLTWNGTAQHYRQIHQRNVGGVFGNVCPWCAEEFGGATALGNHIARRHHAGSIAQGFARAEVEGDPHGIVADLRRKLAAGG